MEKLNNSLDQKVTSLFLIEDLLNFHKLFRCNLKCCAKFLNFIG